MHLAGMFQKEMKSMNRVDLSAKAVLLKVMASELWSCQWDGITVYDNQLNILRTMKGHGVHPGVHSIAEISDEAVAVAGIFHLYLSTKSG